MESLHCFRCFIFPQKGSDFYVSNCMHIFCGKCKKLCDPGEGDAKCVECLKSPIRLLKMGPEMPAQIREMFSPISDDFQRISKEMGRIITFQTRQRDHLISGLSKKEKVFDQLREAHNREKSQREQLEKQLAEAQRLLKSSEEENRKLQDQLATPTFPAPPSFFEKEESEKTEKMENRVFKESMYETPFNKKKQKENEESFKTPVRGAKTSMGFRTPANPPNMFPHLTKKSSSKCSE